MGGAGPGRNPRNVLLKVLGLARGLWDPRPAGRDAAFVIYKGQVEHRHATPSSRSNAGRGGGRFILIFTDVKRKCGVTFLVTRNF